MFFTISVKQSAASCSEDKAAVPFGIGSQPFFSNRFGEQVHLPPEDPAETQFNRGKPDQTDMRVRVELGDKINIAVHIGLAPRHSPEQ
jgi:hypothetical protein